MHYKVRFLIVGLLIFALLIIPSPLVYGAQPADPKSFPVMNQHPELPTGCEATAATILFHYHGKLVSKAEVARKIPVEPVPQTIGDRAVGGDPKKGFVGDPFSSSGFGVYHQPMEALLNEYFPGKVVNLSKEPFQSVLEEVRKGNPMIIWVTIGLAPTEISHFWWTEEEHLIQWNKNLHTVVLFDYDENFAYVSDPYTGKIESYPKNLLERRWLDLGSRAIGIDLNRQPSDVSPGQDGTNNSGNISNTDYELERQRIVKEAQLKKDPKLQAIEQAAQEGSKPKSKLPLWLFIGAAAILLISSTILLIITLKNRKTAKQEVAPTKEED
ncbi:C39 family peptidase [Desulfuribacillus stibiiarsenatis]|nr:C39 family peptidase [Desulfuribacillus stibiiarsenatis]